MMIRAIMSFLGKNEEENRFMFFLALVTEPIIAPVRALLSVFGIGENSPMDIGFFVTAILLSALSYVLPQIPI
ncbi:MAG: YggT family protein [Clostridia bacterium]|nr:YggT family protein [Clostridia bacterium]